MYATLKLMLLLWQHAYISNKNNEDYEAVIMGNHTAAVSRYQLIIILKKT